MSVARAEWPSPWAPKPSCFPQKQLARSELHNLADHARTGWPSRPTSEESTAEQAVCTSTKESDEVSLVLTRALLND